jgi:hypothetical protein
VIENYKTLGGFNACVNNWPFDSAAPDKSTVSRIISRFKSTGSVMNRKPTGRPKTSTTGDDLEEVRRPKRSFSKPQDPSRKIGVRFRETPYVYVPKSEEIRVENIPSDRSAGTIT